MSDNKNALPEKELLWLAIVVLLGFVMRLLFLNAPLGSDDTAYFAMASNLGTDTDFMRNANSQVPLRIGLIAPVAALQNVLGYSLKSYYFFSIGASILLLIMVYLTASKIGGLATAVFSSLLFATSYFGLCRATNLLPDVPNAALLLASFFILVSALESSGNTRLLVISISALTGFLGYLTREPNVVFLAAIPIYELLSRRSLRCTILFVMVFFILWLCEGLFYYVVADDFFLRLRMTLTSTTDWAKHMSEIHLKQFLLEPFMPLGSPLAGKFILAGGFGGTLVAMWKKNHMMLALLVGGLLIFGLYSYSVTSIDPLKRALPLQTRYITVFTAVLTIATGYALAQLKQHLETNRWRRRGTLVAWLLVGMLIVFQVRELPGTLPNTILFKSSSYFVADRLLGENNELMDYKGKIYATPARDFRMYPHFSKLDLIESHASEVEDAKYYLYSRDWVRSILKYGTLKDEHQLRLLHLLLLPRVPGWEYIINTRDIALVHAPSFDFDLDHQKRVVSP
jgi:hypothetical protein